MFDCCKVDLADIGEKMVFLILVQNQLYVLRKLKKQRDHLHHTSHTKVDFKWTVDINTKGKTLKLLEENTEDDRHGWGGRQRSLRTKNADQNGKMGKLYNIRS